MAVTNRAKGAVKTPGWAVRGKLRMAHIPGGPAEAARLIYSGQWDKTPAGLLCASRYNAEFVTELLSKKINAVILTWAPGFSVEGDVPQWELIAALLPLLKKKKIRAIADLSLTGCFAAELLPRVPEGKSWLERQPDGRPVSHQNDNCLQMNVQHEGWRQYLAHKVRMAAGAGFDGFYFSAVHAHEPEAAAFLLWLRETAQAARPPEADEMLFFTSVLLPDVLVASNLKWLASTPKPALDAGNSGANLVALKALFELAGRDVGFAAGLCDGLIEKEARVAAAEILACGGACHGEKVPAAYQAFFAEHAELLGSADPVNSVAVLVEGGADSAAKLSDAAALHLLLRRNVQFDAIPVRQLEKFDLKKYRVVSALQLNGVTPALNDALQAFAQSGGTALVPAGSDAARTVLEKGKGRVISSGAPLSGEAAAVWLADIQNFAGPSPIEVETTAPVIALLWGKGTKRWVHLLNYGAKPADVTIALPGCGGRKLTDHSPDDPAPQLAVIETGTANAKFTLKNLITYTIVEVS